MGRITRFLRRIRGVQEPEPRAIHDILESFQERVGIRFRDQALLRQALTHRSYLGSNGGDPHLSNERIEFLGDAVLELAVIEFLYKIYPEDREGSLTKKKGLLVSRDVLAQCAERMGLGESILLSEAERDSGGRTRVSILADTFEAVVGAIHLDQGLDVARRFVRDRVLMFADAILQDESLSNHKSLLQEHVQARFKTYPRYRVVTESGPDHMKLFSVEVSIRGTLLGRGQGHNKKEAEQMAARDALHRVLELETAPPGATGGVGLGSPGSGAGGSSAGGSGARGSGVSASATGNSRKGVSSIDGSGPRFSGTGPPRTSSDTGGAEAPVGGEPPSAMGSRDSRERGW